MMMEISETDAHAILHGLGWAFSEGAWQDDADSIVERLFEAFPHLKEEFSYLA